MNKKTQLILAAMCAAAAAQSADIGDVIVRQQWPWSTDIKVEYKVTNVTTPVNVSVAAFDGNTQLDSANLDAAIVGDRYGISRSGVYSFTIDPVAAFGAGQATIGDFRVRLSLSDAAANVNDVIYKVFDLTTGDCQDLTRADFYNGKVESGAFVTNFAAIGTGYSTSLDDVFIWTGVTNNIKYKTTHLVMRKIPAASAGVWTMGTLPASTEPSWRKDTNHLVRITYDYYIGVFELTQRQYSFCTNVNSVSLGVEADVLPVNALLFGSETSSKTARWCVKKLGDITGLSGFSLPTEAEWEFACRAGTTSSLNSGENVTSSAYYSGGDAKLALLGWYAGNSGSTRHEVGTLRPNAFGLFDMHGNVEEWCLDWFSDGDDYVASFGAGWTPETVVVDPTGPSEATSTYASKHTTRGGYYGQYAYYVRSASRSDSTKDFATGSGKDGVRAKLILSE